MLAKLKGKWPEREGKQNDRKQQKMKLTDNYNRQLYRRWIAQDSGG